jgi:hypothetical protein
MADVILRKAVNPFAVISWLTHPSRTSAAPWSNVHTSFSMAAPVDGS